MGDKRNCVASVFVGYDNDKKQIAITIMKRGNGDKLNSDNQNNVRLIYAKKYDFLSGEEDFEQLSLVLKEYGAEVCCFSCIEEKDRSYSDVIEQQIEVAHVVTNSPEATAEDVHYQILTTYRKVLKDRLLSFEKQLEQFNTDYKDLVRKLELLNPHQLNTEIVSEPMEIDSLMISLFHGLLVCMKE